MNDLKKGILDLMEELETNFIASIDHGNKAAGRRARKSTLELEKLFKQYRKASLEAEKVERAEKMKKLEAEQQ